jgi:RNA recognition motif-containing protein
MNKLYIANLPYSATEEILRHIFEQVGTVRSATIVKDPQTGNSKGFGFVEMETDHDVDNAIAQFNGDTYDGRVVRVERSKDTRGRRV